MGFSVRFRELLEPGVEQEFTAFMNFLRQFLLREHNEDGTHLPGGSNRQIGEIVAYGGDSAPAGWLLCNGALVSRDTYRDLLGVIGTKFGAGDGNTNFQIPDLRAKFPRGNDGTVGGTGGAATHTHSITSGGAHTHTGATGSESAHTHGVGTYSTEGPSAPGVDYDTGTANTPASAGHTHALAGSSAAGSAHSHTISSDGAHDHGGATGSGSTLPPYVNVNYVIFTGVGV